MPSLKRLAMIDWSRPKFCSCGKEIQLDIVHKQMFIYNTLSCNPSKTGTGAVYLQYDNSWQPIGRVILAINKQGRNVQCDHVNGDIHDNRLENLRIVKPVQNMQNQDLRSNNKSGYIGVSWHKASMAWRSRISAPEGEIYIGLFNSAKEAALARDAKAKELRGEFAVLNFP